MATWVFAATADSLPLGSAAEVVCGDRLVALFHTAEGFFALDGVCPHQGGPLGKGLLRGCVVTCPWHGWQFDVRDGRQQATAAVRHATLPVRREGNQLLVDIEP